MSTNSPSPASDKEASDRQIVSPTASLPDHLTSSDRPLTLEALVNRVAMVMFVSLCAVFGVLLIILPWTPRWTDNYILISYPALRDLLENGFVRGMSTGLGAVDIWIGFWEAMHYHERENRS